MLLKVRSVSLSHFKLKWVVYMTLFLSIFYRLLTDITGIPAATKYIIDLVNIFMFVFALSQRKKLNSMQKKIESYILIMIVISFITYLIHYQSLAFFLYGMVYKFRYYIFVLLCFFYLRKNDLDKIIGILRFLFYVNFLFVLVQYIQFGLYGDFLGGLFGTTQGCNGYLNVFLVVCVGISSLYYVDGKEKFWRLAVEIVFSFIIASLAELKFFYLEFIIILAFTVFFSGFTWKKLLLAMASGVGLFAGFIIFSNIYTYADSFLDIQTWIDAATSSGYSAGYTSSIYSVSEVNRLTFIPILNERVLNTNLLRLFGMGVGNCSFSGIEFLNTPFYKAYSGLRYEWFSSSYIYLESGWVGMILFIGFFALLFVVANRLLRKKSVDRIYCYMTEMMAVLSIVLFIYNNSLTMDSAFLFYFVAVAALIACNDKSRIIKVL